MKTGGTLLTAVGQLAIDSVSRTDARDISEADARRAGYPSRQALLTELDRMSALLRRLESMDARSPSGAWTRRTLELIERHPAVRAGDLAVEMGQERMDFKQNVRKLKKLGLTESLPVGYQLSPRGVAVVKSLDIKSD